MLQREMLQGCTVPPRLLLVLLASLAGLAVGEVGDFSPCLRFFHNNTPPTGIGGGGVGGGGNDRDYACVCQRSKNQYRFASLYDRQRRTSLYSAYLLTPAAGKRPNTKWKYEPQAVPLDYINSTYTRGHLNPSLHHHDIVDRKATFTLTNVVPPARRLQRGALGQAGGGRPSVWGPAHVITGALPYASGQRWIKNRVAVPEYMWSAYCCNPPTTPACPRGPSRSSPRTRPWGGTTSRAGRKIVPVNPKARSKFRATM
ncbi:hypothetical protein CRUP_010603 [Coryphaenoides rupestris]|nr:hypothetical protein CRUP_010603 [Coryphaenoides rupestris]